MDEIAAEQPCDEDEECGMRRSGARYSACYWSGSLGAAHLCATTTNLPTYTRHLQHPQTNNRIWLNETEDHPCGNMTLFGCESRLRTYWHFLHWRRFILLFCLDKWKDWFQTKQKWCVAAPWRIGSTFVGRSTSPSPPVTSCGCIEDRHIKNRFLPSTTFLFCFSKQS